MSENLTLYVIKIINVSKSSIWYYTRKGQTFEAIIEKREGVEMYRVAALTYFYIYPMDAEIVEVKKVPKYTKF
jgi:hypothetical protein